MTRIFAAGEAVWQAHLGTLRQVVRQELVARQLAAHVGSAPRRVLDVGCGQGTQALRLAAAGHSVTAVDSSPSLLAEFAAARASLPPEARDRVRIVEADILAMPVEGAFDVVLCHGVLMYYADPAPLLDMLARRVAPGGLLSLLVRNADGLALRPGLQGDWPTARAALSGTAYRNRLGLNTRADRRADLTAALASRGLTVQTWYGVRLFTDTAPDDAPLPPADELAELLAAEAEAAATDPYRSLAALTHLLASPVD
jgi:S-adenosylmethionine-dependent methyltransferase